jgi:uncharacterized protein
MSGSGWATAVALLAAVSGLAADAEPLLPGADRGQAAAGPPNAAGEQQSGQGTAAATVLDYAQAMQRDAAAELRAIAAGTKAYLPPEVWQPVAYAASAPDRGVTLDAGPLRDCFERNIAYLNRCCAKPGYNDEGENGWVQMLPASAEGRLLGGAGHTLRWGERSDMRAIVDTLVARVKTRQTADGYCLPYDVSYMTPQPDAGQDERRNYDRVCLTRGLVAAGLAGNPDAYPILRRFYDWLNPSPYYPTLLTGLFSGSAHNCNNGHAGGLLLYFSPVGKKEDLVAVERFFVQDFFLERAARAEPLALGYYPFHTPHCYVLLAFESWLDHYRATGAAKYLAGARGAWRIVHGSYEHVGGTIAICEEDAGAYPPQSYYLGKHTGETCGSVFWADFNHRFLQLFPGEARYADEIENVIFNVILACQDAGGSIRYHNHLVGNKDTPRCANTCCEVMGVPFIARLPQYLYSVAADGVYVNLFAPSSLSWRHGGRSLILRTATGFPGDGKVVLALTTPEPVRLKLRLRVPSWVDGEVQIAVNGTAAARGTPGSYVELDRLWSDQDAISVEFPMRFRLVRYGGFDQDAQHPRYALLYGPLLLALVGGTDLALTPDELLGRLAAVDGSPLHFSVNGFPTCTYVPYWQIQGESFTCFPTLR